VFLRQPRPWWNNLIPAAAFEEIQNADSRYRENSYGSNDLRTAGLHDLQRVTAGLFFGPNLCFNAVQQPFAASQRGRLGNGWLKSCPLLWKGKQL
jgi:hypothetical protein